MFHKLGGGVRELPSGAGASSGAQLSRQIPEQATSLPGEPFQREFTPEENGVIPEDNLDDAVSWFQQPEPERRRPPRQLRSRTIGSISWDSILGYRPYDMGEGIVQEEIQEPLPTKPQISWYGWEAKKKWTDHTRNLLHDPRLVGEESIESRSTGRGAVIATSTVEEFTGVPPINTLEGPDVDPGTGSFAVLSQYLITKMDTLERQFQKWHASLMLGLGKHLENVTAWRPFIKWVSPSGNIRGMSTKPKGSNKTRVLHSTYLPINQRRHVINPPWYRECNPGQPGNLKSG